MTPPRAASLLRGALLRIGPRALLTLGAVGVACDGRAALPRSFSLLAAMAMFGVSVILHWDMLDRLSEAEEVRDGRFAGIALTAALSLITASLAAIQLAKTV